MASKNQVTLTFAGNAKPLKDTTTEVDDALKRVGASSDDTNDRMSRLQRLAGSGGREFGEYGKGLGGVGDRFDEIDTRAMGAADGITGVSELMSGAEMSAAEYAMALSDIGSSMYNTVIPSLQSAAKNGGDWLKQMTGAPTTLRAVGRAAALTAGAAGIGALVYSIDQADRAARAADVERLTDDFLELGQIDFSAVELMRGDIDKVFESVLAQSPEMAREFIEMGESLGFTKEKTQEWAAEVRSSTTIQERLGEAVGVTTETVNAQAQSIQALRDQNTALFDPIFAAVNAQRTLAEAEQAVTLAVDEHGRSSQEYRDAQWSAVEATVAADSAVRALAEDVVKNNVDMGTAKRRLEDMAAGSGNAAAMVTYFEGEVARLNEEVRGMTDKTVTVDVVFRRSARDLNVGYEGLYDGRATGGPTPGGWIGEVGEQGREIMAIAKGYTGHVWTPSQFGSFMKAAPDVGALQAGQQTVQVDARQTNINVAGSVVTERKLVAVVRAELDRGGLR